MSEIFVEEENTVYELDEDVSEEKEKWDFQDREMES